MKDATDITVILDRSGSMESIKADTIGGFNNFVNEQKSVPGECFLTLVQFDSQDPQEVVVDHVAVGDVALLTDTTFVPRGSTPLRDAVGQAIVRTGERLAKVVEDERPDKVIFLIITDGEENASHEYSAVRIAEMVKEQSETYKWHFTYIGANQDALTVGTQQIGTQSGHNINYAANAAGVQSVYTSASANVRGVRGGMKADMTWTAAQRKGAMGKGTK